MRVKESNFYQLIAWLNSFGWDKGLKLLEDHNKRLEWLQADLYANGDQKSYKEAAKLGRTIIKQQFTLMRLKAMPRVDLKPESLNPNT